jgi:hypothetical protein
MQLPEKYKELGISTFRAKALRLELLLSNVFISSEVSKCCESISYPHAIYPSCSYVVVEQQYSTKIPIQNHYKLDCKYDYGIYLYYLRTR